MSPKYSNWSTSDLIMLDQNHYKGHILQQSICVRYLRQGRGHNVSYRLCELQSREVIHHGITHSVTTQSALSVADAIKD